MIKMLLVSLVIKIIPCIDLNPICSKMQCVAFFLTL
jgi:hypothetical protein